MRVVLLWIGKKKIFRLHVTNIINLFGLLCENSNFEPYITLIPSNNAASPEHAKNKKPPSTNTSSKWEKKFYSYCKLLHEGFLLKKINFIEGDVFELKTYLTAYETAQNDYGYTYLSDENIVYEKRITSNDLICVSLILNKLPKLKVEPMKVVSWMFTTNNGQELLPQSLKNYLTQQNTIDTSHSLSQKPHKKSKHGAVSVKDTAKLLGVSERTIYNWEKGKTILPQGYPGRADAITLRLFANDFHQKKSLSKTALNIKNLYHPENIKKYTDSDMEEEYDKKSCDYEEKKEQSNKTHENKNSELYYIPSNSLYEY